MCLQVIGADPSLALDEVGVPMSIAKRMTIPEKVTPFNMQKMKERIRIGGHDLGGALYVIKAYDGTMYDLSLVQSTELVCQTLAVGDTVERMLKNGDFVAMNRQPSLHKFSIQAMRVRVLPAGSSFKLNLSVTSPFNAVRV